MTAAIVVPDEHHRCALCDEVTTGAAEFLVRFTDGTTRHFHGSCHYAWMMERQAFGGP
jgi:hypothetical protein